MQTKFKTLQSLLDFFKDEETCKAYYEQARWGGNVACPHCGSLKIYRTNRGYKCGEKECAKKFSLTVGTIFENSKIPLRTWFAAMYLCTTSKKGISSVQLSEQLGITQKTAWFVLSRIRTMLNENANNQEQLSGMVEVDETYIGGKEKNKSKSKRAANRAKNDSTGKLHAHNNPTNNKTAVLGILQRNGKVRVQPMVAPTKQVLLPLLAANISKDAVVVTDGLRSYQGLDKTYKLHVVVNHAKDEWVKGEYSTNGIEGFWAILKRGIYGIYHSVSAKHLQRYCNEFGYRYNTRELTGVERFENAVLKVSGTRITYRSLIEK